MTGFLQLLFQGVALGSLYALVALGFVIIFRASQVINFAQGALLMLGAYLTSWLTGDLGLSFAIAALLAVAALAVASAGFQVAVLRPLGDQPLFVGVMITIGLSIAVSAAVAIAFGPSPRVLGDPWGSSSVVLGSVTFAWVKLWAIAIALGLLLAFFVFDRRSRYGLAMRATAADYEAALAAGVPVARVHALAWAMAGALAAIAGTFLAGYPNAPNLGLADIALRAFPAIILGGMASPVGAVVGGITIGVVEVLTSGYQPAWLGDGFYLVAPYIVMIIVLLVRPYGLFGSKPAERV